MSSLFTGKLDEAGNEIWGRCQHPITAGAGTGFYAAKPLTAIHTLPRSSFCTPLVPPRCPYFITIGYQKKGDYNKKINFATAPNTPFVT